MTSCVPRVGTRRCRTRRCAVCVAERTHARRVTPPPMGAGGGGGWGVDHLKWVTVLCSAAVKDRQIINTASGGGDGRRQRLRRRRRRQRQRGGDTDCNTGASGDERPVYIITGLQHPSIPSCPLPAGRRFNHTCSGAVSRDQVFARLCKTERPSRIGVCPFADECLFCLSVLLPSCAAVFVAG